MRAAVPGALHRHDVLDRRSGANLVQRQRERALDEPVHPEPPARSVDLGYVVVRQQVVEPDRRDVPAERLERQRVVPGGELKLLETDPFGHERETNGICLDRGRADRSRADEAFVLAVLAELALCMSIGMLLVILPVYANDELGAGNFGVALTVAAVSPMLLVFQPIAGVSETGTGVVF